MRFADLERITWSPCFVRLVQWRQVIFDRVLSLLFFSRLGIGWWFWPWHHSRGDKSILFLTTFFPITWIKVLNRCGRPVAAVSCHPYHWRWTTTQPWTLWTARWSPATLPPATVSSTLWTAGKTGRQVTSLDGIGRHGLTIYTPVSSTLWNAGKTGR